MKINNRIKSIMWEDILKMWNKLNKKTVVIKDAIVPGANLKDPIPKQETNK